MKTVYFLGAGASADAGYPVTAHLLTEMQRQFASTLFAQEREDWRHFKEFRESAVEPLSMILRSENPELVLTVPDLLEATLNDADARNWRRVRPAFERGNQGDVSEVNSYWNDPRRDKLVLGIRAKQAFQRLADRFFSHKHCEDSKDSEKNRRTHLAKALAPLKSGDTVITTNWDTLAERVLLENGKWFPTDGYGFNVPITIGPQWRRDRQRRLNQRSRVRVLKLHGSIGWFKGAEGEGRFYLRYPSYLQYFLLPGYPEIHDGRAPPPGHGPDLNPVVVFPSYLKQLDDQVLQAIWDQAARALHSAQRIVCVGYSLPMADVAVRVLLNPVRKRLADRECSVTVVIGRDREAQLRWKAFLGSGVKIVEKTAGEYFR